MRNPSFLLLSFCIIGCALIYLIITYRNENLTSKERISYLNQKWHLEKMKSNRLDTLLVTCKAQSKSYEQGIKASQHQMSKKEEELSTKKADLTACSVRRNRAQKFYDDVKVCGVASFACKIIICFFHCCPTLCPKEQNFYSFDLCSYYYKFNE